MATDLKLKFDFGIFVGEIALLTRIYVLLQGHAFGTLGHARWPRPDQGDATDVRRVGRESRSRKRPWVQRVYANGTTAFSSYDGERRITRHDHRRTSDNQRVRGFEYAWDREDNRRFEQRLTVNTSPTESTGPGEFAKYDSIYRLTRFRKDVATSGLDSITNNATSVTEPSSTKVTDYNLDGVGNRTSTVVDGATTAYTMQLGGATKDKEVNQYTQVGSNVLCYDDAGNTYFNGTNRYFWDFADRMVQLITATDDVRYAYDALGRRIAKRSQNGLFTTVLYWCDGDRVIEETDDVSPTPNLTRRYVYGIGIDEVLTVTARDVADVNNNGNTTEFVTLYFHESSLGSVAALTRDDGATVEAYRYDAYGAFDEILNKSGSAVTVTQVKNPVGFQGRWHEFQEGSGLIDFRARKLDPGLGRFVSRDTKDVWGNTASVGNPSTFCRSNPLNYVDPSGEQDRFGTDPAWGDPNRGHLVGEPVYPNPRPLWYPPIHSHPYFRERINAERVAVGAGATGVSGWVAGGAAAGGAKAAGALAGAAGRSAGGAFLGEIGRRLKRALDEAIRRSKTRKPEVCRDPGRRERGGPPEFKKPKSGTPKEKATDVLSWLRDIPQGRPFKGESGKDFARRMMDKRWGKDCWEKDPKRLKEFSELQKYGDRAFE